MQRGIFRGELDDEQRAVFALVSDGKTGREIAASLGICPSRVEGLVRRTCRQLGVRGRREAAAVMASHFGWKSADRGVAEASKAAGEYHFGTQNAIFTAKMDHVKDEHQHRPSYARDVRGFHAVEMEVSSTVDSIPRPSFFQRNHAVSLSSRHVLTIASLIASSALALSGLIAAMQGFNVLIAG